MIETAISLSTRGHFRILKSGHFNFLLTIYDAVAEWQAQRLRSKLDPDTIKMLKDQLLRVSFQMEKHAIENSKHI